MKLLASLAMSASLSLAQFTSLYYCADAGASDTYACNISPAPVPLSYQTGFSYSFKANTANTGAASINFNSLGPITIVKVAGGVATALSDNDIRAGQVVDLRYDGTNMEMQSTSGLAKATSPIVNADLPTLTYTQSVFGGANLIPDSSGNVFAEPFTILSGTAFFAYQIMAFADTATLDCMYTRWNVPINYTTGATTWIVDWNTTATTGNAVWTLDYRDVSTATLAATTSQESLTVTTAASGTASARTQSTMTATASNFSAGDIIQIRVCRNGAGADTITATLAIHDIRFSFVGRP